MLGEGIGDLVSNSFGSNSFVCVNLTPLILRGLSLEWLHSGKFILLEREVSTNALMPPLKASRKCYYNVIINFKRNTSHLSAIQRLLVIVIMLPFLVPGVVVFNSIVFF